MDLSFVKDALPNGNEVRTVKTQISNFFSKRKKGSEKTISISLYGGIDLNPCETELIDTPEMQRLRGIKQLGAAHLVYPDATHNRFGHSLGVNFLAKRVLRSAKFVDEGKIVGTVEGHLNEQILEVLALLHDVGHPPFGHEIERVIRAVYGLTHEEMAQFLIRNPHIQDVLESHNIEPNIVAAIFEGENSLDGDLSPIRDLISSPLDLDKMDYLIRDAQNTGVLLGICDVSRIISTMVVYKEGDKYYLALLDKGFGAMESLIMAREWMFFSVNKHRTVSIAENMLVRAVYEKLSSEKWKKNEAIGCFLSMDDPGLLSWLEESDSLSPQKIVHRIKNRILYKQLAEYPIASYSMTIKDEIMKFLDLNYRIQVENDFEENGFYRGEIIIDFSPVVSDIVEDLRRMPVCQKDSQTGRIRPPREAAAIEDARPFLKTLRDRRSAGEENRKIRVYEPKGKEKPIKKAFEERFPTTF